MKMSVITVCLNAENEIEKTLSSIAAQSHVDTELVVVDGGSADGTLEVIERFAPSIAVMRSGKDRGIYDAMNKGLALSSGDAVIFMNAGDWFASEYAVGIAADYLVRHPDVSIVYGGIEVRHPDGRTGDFMPPPHSEALDFLILNSLPHQATFARRSVFARIGLFDTRYRSHADYNFFLKASTDPQISMRLLPVIVASFGLGGASSNLERGERERHTIQNSTPALQSRSWLRRRIEFYQEHYIAQRLRLEALETEAAARSLEDRQGAGAA